MEWIAQKCRQNVVGQTLQGLQGDSAVLEKLKNRELVIGLLFGYSLTWTSFA
ncbi:hypothetical protein SPRA44_670024 [Serratia proteamaculans]|uniref:hypothetical protein n=1 Tax=Serratia proteamaculans TaxID=28151 RepID=UPI0009F7ED94|nr:hypothetical protein [Serratia proteamaculans]SMB48654.1 hypothetical protein SPRA44_670024 [Serratia proteamaculans]